MRSGRVNVTTSSDPELGREGDELSRSCRPPPTKTKCDVVATFAHYRAAAARKGEIDAVLRAHDRRGRRRGSACRAATQAPARLS